MCLAQTRNYKQCKRQSIKGGHFCHQHHAILNNYITIKNITKTKQNGGGFGLLPSCLDILQCDWVTDATYAVPGLNSILSFIS
jgi:hypothetical protein